jgi:hypothetical protein
MVLGGLRLSRYATVPRRRKMATVSSQRPRTGHSLSNICDWSEPAVGPWPTSSALVQQQTRCRVVSLTWLARTRNSAIGMPCLGRTPRRDSRHPGPRQSLRTNGHRRSRNYSESGRQRRARRGPTQLAARDQEFRHERSPASKLRVSVVIANRPARVRRIRSRCQLAVMSSAT